MDISSNKWYTEVLVLSYIHWGEEFLNRIDGMFSFVILDLKTIYYSVEIGLVKNLCIIHLRKIS